MDGRSGGSAGVLPGDPAAAGDADLARAWADGDPRAFEEAYRRFAPALFGTAVGLLGDRAAAADVVHDTFVRAAPRVAGLREPDRLRAWLFAILRNEAASHHRSRRHDGGSLDDAAGGAMSERLVDGAAPADVEASRAELADLVWTAAEGLQDRDREVLELNVRGGLDTADLADALGVTPGHAAVLLSRMRDRLERCLGALLVARVGRRDCDALDRLLDGWDGRFSLDVRSKVTRHVEGCPRCNQQRSALVSMERLAPALLPPVVLLPTDLRDRLVASLGPDGRGAGGAGGSGGSGGDAGGWRDDGFPEQTPHPVRRPAAEAAGLGGAALLAGGLPTGTGRSSGFVGAHRMRRGRARPLVALGVLVVLLLGGGTAVVAGMLRSGPESVQVRVVGTVPGATSVTSAPSSAAPSSPASVTTKPPSRTSTRAVPTSATRTPRTTTTTRATTTTTTRSPTTTTRSTPPSVTTTTAPPPPPTIDRLAASPAEVFVPGGGCQPLQSKITVAFTATGTATVTGTWSPDGTATSPLTFSGTGPVRTATVGPYRAAHADTVSVTVTDANGSVTKTVGVTASVCIG